MTTTVAEARSIMLNIFKTKWSELQSPAYWVEYESTAGQPPTSRKPWARVTLRHRDGPQASLTGAEGECRRYSQFGTIYVQLFGPMGSGMKELYRLAGGVQTAYNQARRLPVIFRNVRIQEAGPSTLWDQINVVIDFVYDKVE